MNRKQSSTGDALNELGELFLSRCQQFCYSIEKDKLWRLLNTSFSIHPHIIAVFTYSRHAFEDCKSVSAGKKIKWNMPILLTWYSQMLEIFPEGLSRARHHQQPFLLFSSHLRRIQTTPGKGYLVLSILFPNKPTYLFLPTARRTSFCFILHVTHLQQTPREECRLFPTQTSHCTGQLDLTSIHYISKEEQRALILIAILKTD